MVVPLGCFFSGEDILACRARASLSDGVLSRRGAGGFAGLPGHSLHRCGGRDQGRFAAMRGMLCKCRTVNRLHGRTRRGCGRKNGLLVGSTGQRPLRRGERVLAAKRLRRLGLQVAHGLAWAACSVELPNGRNPKVGPPKGGNRRTRFPPCLTPEQGAATLFSCQTAAEAPRRDPRRLPLGGLVSRIRFGPAELAGIPGWALY